MGSVMFYCALGNYVARSYNTEQAPSHILTVVYYTVYQNYNLQKVQRTKDYRGPCCKFTGKIIG